MLQYELNLPASQRSRERIIEYIKVPLQKNVVLHGISAMFKRMRSMVTIPLLQIMDFINPTVGLFHTLSIQHPV